jgi:hypothetical protein
MRRLLVCVAVVVALGIGFALGRFLPGRTSEGPAQQAPDEKKPASAADTKVPAAPPGFALSPAKHDFGKLFEGEARTTELVIERPGQGALRLGRLYSPCPCIRVEAAPLVIEAGKPAKVNVLLHSLTLEGKKSFPVYVELLEPAKGVLRADVTCDVERVPARLMLNPEAFHFGSASSAKTATVKLTNLTKYPMTVQEVTSSLVGSAVEMKGPKTLSPGESGELALSLAVKDQPAGPIRGEVVVKTDSPLHGLVRVPVDGTVTK